MHYPEFQIDHQCWYQFANRIVGSALCYQITPHGAKPGRVGVVIKIAAAERVM